MSGSSSGPSGSACLRLMSDLKQLNTDPPDGVSASPVSDDNMYLWQATIIGPDESPWEGGIYSVRLTFTEQYPTKPPRVRFLCEMFHPNVYADGTLCLDIIQDLWSPIMTTSMILTSIQSLLTDPNPASPANPEAAKLFTTNVKEYRRQVRRIAERSLETSC